MFKMKKVIASLACAIMVFMSMSTLCLAVEELDIKLNRRVTFVGDTYYDWNGKKVRKDNGDDEETSGMIISINNRKSKGIYISGKGYIGRDQIKAVEGKILEVEFDKDTLTSSLKFDGDYVNIESTNDGVLEYEDGVLKVGLETGKTTITIENEDGKLVEMEAEVTDTTVTLNIPEKSAELAVEEATLVVKVPDEETGEDKEIIEVTGKGNATAKVELENGTVKVDATAKADGTVEVKGEEIIKAAIDANATITGTMDEKGLTVTGKGDVNADASIIVDGEEVVKAEIDATGTVTGTVNEEGLTVTGKGEADTTVTVKDKEVVKAEIEVEGSANANLEDGVTVKATTTQTYTLLDKIKAKLKGEAVANVNKENASVTASGSAEVNDKEIASGTATIEGNHGEDPVVKAEGKVVGQEVKVPETKIPIVSMLKKLLNR